MSSSYPGRVSATQVVAYARAHGYGSLQMYDKDIFISMGDMGFCWFLQVGSYFVGQYYLVLQQQPDRVHQFYTEGSTMIRVDGDSSESASAMLVSLSGTVCG